MSRNCKKNVCRYEILNSPNWQQVTQKYDTQACCAAHAHHGIKLEHSIILGKDKYYYIILGNDKYYYIILGKYKCYSIILGNE